MTAKPKEAADGRAKATETPTKRRLLQAATVAFARAGYEGARVNDIAAQAKANKQLVYHYFGSKEALYRAVVEELYLEYRGNEAALEKIVLEPDPELAIRKLARHLFTPGDALRGFQRLLQDLNQHKRRRLLTSMDGVQASYTRLIEVVDTILKRGVETGAFKPGIDPKEFYVTLTGACSVRVYNAASLSFMLGMDLESSAGNLESQEAGISLLMEGMRPKSPAGS